MRVLEVYKHQFQDLNEVITRVKGRNYKFIIFMDDLSFEDFEIEYKYLKAVIEGGLEKRPENILIYATSNRRHLIRENYGDKTEDGHFPEVRQDMHTSDTVQEKLSLAYSEEHLDIHPDIPVTAIPGDGTTPRHPRIIPQKQEGLYALHYHPPGGSPHPEFFRSLYNAILPMEDAVLRISPDQSLYILNLTGSEAEKLLPLTADSAETLFETSVSCIGASICQIGARDSQALLAACLKRVRQEHFPDGVLPKIHISGCPSSCSGHQIASLGFRGGVRQTPDGPRPAFAVYEMGCPLRGREAFGTELGLMLESEIPEFLVELGTEIAARSMTYEQFVKEHHDDFLNIVKKYL